MAVGAPNASVPDTSGDSASTWVKTSTTAVKPEDTKEAVYTAVVAYNNALKEPAKLGRLALVQAARAKALLDARDYVLPDDVKQLSASVLAHRLVLTPEAEMDGTSADDILTQTLSRVSLRRG